MEARPREHAVNDIVGVGNTFTMRETEIACTRGADTLWSDRVSGNVTVLAGNANFWAVGCEDGCLQVSMELPLMFLVLNGYQIISSTNRIPLLNVDYMISNFLFLLFLWVSCFVSF